MIHIKELKISMSLDVVASLMHAGVKGESARIQTRRKSTNGRS
jgi:hypothetical protein